MALVNQNRVAASRRLMKDLEEMRKSPVVNISAVPLDDNLFEWHCCVVVSDVNFHVILYFPENYPNSGPSAEFFPVGLRLRTGASTVGKKGMKFCLSFLSDYNYIHHEWQKDVGYGWSASCTAQALLLNICAALSEFNGVELNTALLEDKSITCMDCGHTCESPFPPLPQITGEQTTPSPDTNPAISCYISRDAFCVDQEVKSNDEVFGFGVEIRTNNESKPLQYLASPCETLTFGSFQRMKETLGFVQSSIKEEVTQFLPLYIHPNQGEFIKSMFESRIEELCKGRKARGRKKIVQYTMVDKIIDVLPNLMATTVEDFTMALEGSSALLNGFFSFHRLLLWACETYPGLQETIEQRIQEFIEDENNRHKKKCPFTEEWLMLLTVVSDKYRWEDVAEKYIMEVWNRTVFSLIKEFTDLGDESQSNATVLPTVFKLTAALNKRIALQMFFLTVACPMGWSREDIIRRYDNNLGLPTNEMIDEVRDGLKSTRDSTSFADWFKIWKFEPISDEDIRLRLIEVVQFSVSTTGYRKSRINCGWKRLINRWQSRKDRTICKKLLMRPFVKVPKLNETHLSAIIPSAAKPSTSHGSAHEGLTSSATCIETVSKNQGPQPMETGESSNLADSELTKEVDNAPAPRPNLWPSMTMNNLSDLKQKRHLQIFKDSTDIGRLRRIQSCLVFSFKM